MTSIELEYELPAYTGAGDKKLTQKHGNIKAPVGTRVEFRMATNIDETNASLNGVRNGDATSVAIIEPPSGSSARSPVSRSCSA